MPTSKSPKPTPIVTKKEADAPPPSAAPRTGPNSNGWSTAYARAVLSTVFYDIGSAAYKTAVFGLNKNAIAVGLHINYPGDVAPVVSEVSTASTGYARLYLPTDEATWGLDTIVSGTEQGFRVYNKIPLVFGPSTGHWGGMNYYSLHAGRVDGTTKVSGEYIGNGYFNDPTPVITPGFAFKIPVAGLTFTLGNI